MDIILLSLFIFVVVECVVNILVGVYPKLIEIHIVKLITIKIVNSEKRPNSPAKRIRRNRKTKK